MNGIDLLREIVSGSHPNATMGGTAPRRRADAFSTVDLAVKLLKPIRPTSGRLRAEGSVVHVGGRVGTAEGRLVGDDGTVYATGTTTCLIIRADR